MPTPHQARTSKHPGRRRAALVVVLLAGACAAPAQAAAAATWTRVSGGPDNVLTDVRQGIDGTRHAVFLQRRAAGGAGAFDVLDRQLTRAGTLADELPVVTGWSSVSGARLLPTASGLIALVTGRPTTDDQTHTLAFRAPLGGGAWSPILAPDADYAAGDTFLADVVQQFSGLAAAKLVAGPTLAPLPDQTLLLTRGGDEIRRILTGAGTTPQGRLQPADGGAKSCDLGRSAAAADPAGRASVVYDLGSPDEAKDGRCPDALLRQPIDPATLQGTGPPVGLKVPASLGGAAALGVDPDPTFGSRAILDVFPGPDGRPWVLHSLELPEPIDRRQHLTPSDPRFFGHTEFGLWDADNRFRRVPRFTPPGDRVPDRISTFDPAAPVVRAFPDGDVVVTHATASHRLQLKSCAYLRKLEAYQRHPKHHRPPPIREFKRCRYQLFPPAAIVVARLHAGRWSFKELPGPSFPHQVETLAALRVLGDSAKDLVVAVQSDVRVSTGPPSDLSSLFKTRGHVFLQRVVF